MPFRRLPALSSLRAFEAAARLTSFKGAAAELHVTPGAVSQQIRGLEADLDVKLFIRGTRAVTLTDAGIKLQAPVTAAFLQLRDAVEETRVQPQTPLVVEAGGPVIRKWLLPRLHRFSERHPDMLVTVQSDFAMSSFGEEGADVSIRFTRAPTSDLYCRFLRNERILPLACPGLVEKLGLKQPNDMVRAPLVHENSHQMFNSPEEWPNWQRWFQSVGLDPAGAHRGMHFCKTDADHAIDAAAVGTGVVLGREFLAQTELSTGKLVSPFGPVAEISLGYYLVCKKGTETRRDIAAFIDWVCDEITEPDELHL